VTRQRGRGLGRGLEALIPIGPGTEGGQDPGLPQFIDVDQVRPSPEQMRKNFPAESLRELADSIRQHGVLQPILVRRLPDGYELIAGERRWRAARLAGVQRVPADSEDSLLLGLIENLQREDLDPIEEARGIKRLIDQFHLTHEEAANRLGKHRVAVTQALRLLTGCPAVLSAAAAGAISAGHARALVGLPTPDAQEQGLKVVLGRNLSVRDTERWVHDFKPPPPARKPEKIARPAAGDGEPAAGDGLADVATRLHERFGDSASISGSRGRGHLTLRYESVTELDDMLELLLGR
jgi:ParB family transcriptional regulator, chromosome partitioning protein